MHIKEIIEALNYNISGGTEYQWNCYPDARFLDFENKYADVGIVFSTSNQMVYEITVASKSNKRGPYRWIDPNHIDAYEQEAQKRNIDSNIAWDDVKYIILETENDILTKTTAIFKNKVFDPRIEIDLDLDDETILELSKQAHKRDVTLNAMVEIVLRHFIDHGNVNGFHD